MQDIISTCYGIGNDYCVHLTRMEQVTAGIEKNTEVVLRIGGLVDLRRVTIWGVQLVLSMYIIACMPIIYIDTCNLRAIKYCCVCKPIDREVGGRGVVFII